MVPFLLYLFEAGMCLTILFLVYVLFFRKETYFTFNRLYLSGILILSLFIPLINLTINVPSLTGYEQPVSDIGKMRSYYTSFIAAGDPEFSASPYVRYRTAVFEGSGTVEDAVPFSENYSTVNDLNPDDRKIKPAQVLMWVYIAGLVFFMGRLIYLIFWLRRLIRRSVTREYGKYKVVLMHEKMAPFSFFRYIFIHENDTKLVAYEQILTHEKVHVMQGHSLDLFLAHAVSVFQWFNPLVWQVQKAIKTTHEYIADRNVVQQGYELFDYQTVLLNQLVSNRSVELVNNFNLLFIKKRIAMMTKNSSGFPAKLKAVLVIPAAIFVFLFFAHLTLESPVFSATNDGAPKVSKFDGFWKSVNETDENVLIHFTGNELSILKHPESTQFRELNIEFGDDQFILPGINGGEALRYSFEGERLRVYWTSKQSTLYDKTRFENSAEVFAPKYFNMDELPTSSMAAVLTDPELTIEVFVKEGAYYIADKKVKLSQLKDALAEQIKAYSVIDRPYILVKVYASAKSPVEGVYELQLVMRELEIYKIAFAAIPENDCDDILTHACAFTMHLPPKDAVMLDKSLVGDKLFEYSADDDMKKVGENLLAHINSHEDYIGLMTYKNTTQYGHVISGASTMFSVVYSFRDNYAQKKYGVNYTDLPNALQKEVRKKYKIILTQNNFDEDQVEAFKGSK